MLPKTILNSHAIVLAIAFIFVSSSCDKDSLTSKLDIEGSSWKLQAAINTQTGNMDSYAEKGTVVISFPNNSVYNLKIGDNSLSAPYFISSYGETIYTKPDKSAFISEQSSKIVADVLRSSRTELIGSTLKLIDPETKTLLVFERIK